MAVAAAKAFLGDELEAEAIAAGLKTVSWPGRLQRLKQGPVMGALGAANVLAPESPDVWIDGGHNEAAGAAMASAMAMRSIADSNCARVSSE